MTNEPQAYDDRGDSVFDVTKQNDTMKFLGLLEQPVVSDNKLTGLFDWLCPACGAPNRDAVVIEAQQGFLGHWSCDACAQSHVARFRARASAEWIAGHTLAVTGSALCHLVEDDRLTEVTPTDAERRRTGSQRVFAWVSIPVLIATIVLALSGASPLSHSSAALSGGGPSPLPLPPAVARLAGAWIEQDGDDRLYFGRFDPVAQAGSCIYFPQGQVPGRRGWFSVIHEDAAGEQLVIEYWSERAGGAPTSGAAKLLASEVMVHIPIRGRSLTWVSMQNGAPILKHYRRVEAADPSRP
jgi:hypothetical protein